MVRPLFETLAEVGTLLLVGPNAIMGLLKDPEKRISRLDPKLIVPYLSLREDYHAARLERLFPHLEHSFDRLVPRRGASHQSRSSR